MNQFCAIRYVSEITSVEGSETVISLCCPDLGGLCIFVEQLCLVASRQVSRHLKGRSVCHASLPPSLLDTTTSPSHPSFLRFSSLLHAGYPWAPDQTSKQTEQQKNPSSRQCWSGLGGEMGRDLCLLSGPVPFHCDGREALPGHSYPHICLTSKGDQGGPQSALIHHLPTQYTTGCIHGPVAFT